MPSYTLPLDANSRPASGGYTPTIGVITLQTGTPTTDGLGVTSAPLNVVLVPDSGTYREQSALSAGYQGAYLVPMTDVSAFKWLSLHITGDYNGTLAFQVSNNGQDWDSYPMSQQSIPGVLLPSVTNQTGIFGGPVIARYFQVQMVNYVTGIATGTLEQYVVPPALPTAIAPAGIKVDGSGVTQPVVGVVTINTSNQSPIPITGVITTSDASVGTIGTTAPGSASLIGASDGTNLHGLLVDGSGNLKVNVVGGTVSSTGGGGGGGTSNLDTGALLTASGVTTTQVSSDQKNTGGLGAKIVLNMTSVGTGSVSLLVEGKDATSGQYYPILQGTAVTANGTYAYTVYPGCPVGPNVAIANEVVLPATWRIRVLANNANATTYTVGASLIGGAASVGIGDTGSLISASGVTTSQASSDQVNTSGQGAKVVLNMTSVGTGSVSLFVEGKDTASGQYYPILQSKPMTANGVYVYTVYPGVPVAESVLVANELVLPATWRVRVVANNANATTYTVGASVFGASSGNSLVSSSFGNAFPSTGLALGASDGTNLKSLLVDGSGYLKVNVVAGGGAGGTSLADDATFTAGTTSLTPSGGVYNDLVTSATSGHADAVRITAKRAFHTNLRDSSGNELLGSKTSAGSVPVVIASDQGAVTISGTVTANIGTMNGLALDTSVNGLLLAQGSTTSGQKGSLILGAVSTSAPSYTTAQSSPLSLDPSGLLRASLKDTPSNTNNLNVNLAASSVTQAVSGTVTANAGTGPFPVAGMVASGSTNANNPVKVGGVYNSTQPTVTTGQVVDAQSTARGARIVATGTDTFNVTVNAALPAGAATIGSVMQASGPWSQNITQIGSSSLALGQTIMASSLPVTMASNQGAIGSVVVQAVAGTALSVGSNALPILTSAATGYVSAYGSNAAALTANTDYSFKWGVSGTTQVNHLMIINNSTIPLNWDLDTATTAGSPTLSNTVGCNTLFLDVQTTVLHIQGNGTPNINGTSAANIVVRGWL